MPSVYLAPLRCPHGNTDIAMPDALTESFCERCGTRHEFAAPTRLSPIRKTRGLVGGLKNYVLGHDSLSDSVGDAMRVEEEVLAAGQLEAFHASFNFCIQCRQYTCLNCWNHEAGRCQTCEPLPVPIELVASALTLAFDAGGIDLLEARPEAAAWPVSDLSEPEPEPEPVVAYEPEPEPEPVVAYEPEPEPEPVVAYEPEPEPEPVVAYEPEPEPEPVVAYEPEPEPEPVVAYEPEPEPEPVVHIPQAEPPRPDLRVAASAEPEPFSEARRSQLDLLGLGDPGPGPIGPNRSNVLPYRSSGAAPNRAESALNLAAARGGFWDASAREVSSAITGVGVQNCGACGLSLSASARFCRRCGTPQARSA